MGPKFKGGFKVKKTNTGLKLVIGAVAAVLFLLIGLGSVVVMDNNKICSKIGLSGFISDSCFGKPGQSFNKVAIVVGNTANTPEPTIRKEIQGYIASSLIQEESEIEVYSVTPDKKKFSIKGSIDSDSNLEDRVQAVSDMLDDIKEKISTAPTASGAQYLEAIIRASRSMSLEDNEKGVVIVIGSGLSDGGVLNFADNDILDRDIDSLMEELTDENNRALPKNLLKNTTVVWNGLGEVAFPQLELTPSQNESLREIYENVLGKNGLGAKKVIWKDGTDYTQSIKTNKTVKVTKTEMESGNSGREITLSIDFKENSASIKDISKAESDLAGIISELKKYKSKTIYLEGYVGLAKCGDQPDNKLATKRAEAVKDLLIENGISESRIRAEGKGKGPNNECEGGKYDEKVSDKNKFVKLIYKD